MLSLVRKLLAVESPVSRTSTHPPITSQKASGLPHTCPYVYFHQPSASFLTTHASLCLHSFLFPFPILLLNGSSLLHLKQLWLLLAALHKHCHMTCHSAGHPMHAMVKLLLYLFVFVCLHPVTYDLIIWSLPRGVFSSLSLHHLLPDKQTVLCLLAIHILHHLAEAEHCCLPYETNQQPQFI